MKITKLLLITLFSIAVAACGGGGGGTGSATHINATATTTAQNLTVSTAMSSFPPLTASGGATPYTYSYTGTLPSGLSFSTSTGAVTGTPTAAYATASLVFSVRDANNNYASTTSTVSFTVGAASVNISATATTTALSLTVGTAMTSFSPLTPSGGTTPYTYSYTGALPTGLSFNASTGAVTGTPTAAYATASLVFSVKDANNNYASTTGTVSFTVGAAGLPAGYVVQGGLTWMPVTFTNNWTNANAYCANTTINGQTGWRMPTQAELGALYASGAMNGQGWTLYSTWSSTPYVAGYHYNVYLDDGYVGWYNDPIFNYVSCVSSGGGMGSPINATATTTAQSLTVGTAMTSFSPLAASGGATPYTYSYTGTLPAGLSFSTSTGAVTGTPTAAYATASLVFSVKDANNNYASTTSTVSFHVAAYVVQGGLTWMPVTFYDTWSNANAYCANTTINGQARWRMPTQAELSALYASGAMNGQGWTLLGTWSSTVCSSGGHCSVDLSYGNGGWYYDTYGNSVSCVR